MFDISFVVFNTSSLAIWQKEKETRKQACKGAINESNYIATARVKEKSNTHSFSRP